jgi:hypothetical protein
MPGAGDLFAFGDSQNFARTQKFPLNSPSPRMGSAMAYDVIQPSHLSLPDHMNCFIALDRAPRSIKRAEAQFAIDSSLYWDVLQITAFELFTSGAKSLESHE